MSEAPITTKPNAGTPKDRSALAASGSVLGAILASSCCVLPLVLVTLGARGAWIGNLTALEPYKPLFAVVTIGFLAVGFWRVYREPKIACDDGSFCATPTSGRITKAALWIATVLVALALTIDFWAPLFY